MAGVTTHVLDTAHGCPAAGMTVEFAIFNGGQWQILKSETTNADGRAEAPLLGAAEMKAGTYRLVFGVADYFRKRGVSLPDPPFLDRVSLEFGVADTGAHYHVPLLCSPWSYSTYRGS